jgi:hypothetical protein
VIWVGVTAFGADSFTRAGRHRPSRRATRADRGQRRPGRAGGARHRAARRRDDIDVRRDRRARTLRVRDATGQGQRIDVSLLGVLTTRGPPCWSYLLAGEVVPEPATAATSSRRRASTSAATVEALCLTCPSEVLPQPVPRARLPGPTARFAHRDRSRTRTLDAIAALRDFSRDTLISSSPPTCWPRRQRDPVVSDPQIPQRHDRDGRPRALGPLGTASHKVSRHARSIRRAPRCSGSTRANCSPSWATRTTRSRAAGCGIVANRALRTRDGGPEGARRCKRTNLKIVVRGEARAVHRGDLTAFRT